MAVKICVKLLFLSRYSGLREMADLVNRNVTKWWRDEYADLASVHTLHDYFLGTDMVQVAIERNQRLGQQQKIKRDKR